MKASPLALGVLVGIFCVGLTACATRGYVEEQIGQAIDTQVGVLQERVKANEAEINRLRQSDAEQDRQLGKLSVTAQEALARAQEAGKLAKGKFVFLYETVMSDELFRFAFDSGKLSKELRTALDEFASGLKKENKSVYIEIQGHTDSLGSEAYNLKLGLARSTAVMNYLYAQHRIPLHRMNAFSYGESKPVVDNSTSSNRAKNRRVTLVVIE